MDSRLVVVKGGGDLATGIIHRIWRAGFQVVITEVPQPMAIRRTVSLAEAVYKGTAEVEGVQATCISDPSQVAGTLAKDIIPVLLDPEAKCIRTLRPVAVVDAIVAKKNIGTCITDAPIVIGIGPGFSVNKDVHAVIETERGHNLGRVLLEGSAAPNTGIPGLIHGYAEERVLYSPGAGIFQGVSKIGDFVEVNDIIAHVGEHKVRAKISGVLRGILHDGLRVAEGVKIGDIDARAKKEHCFTISDKARAVGGGVLEALLYLSRN